MHVDRHILSHNPHSTSFAIPVLYILTLPSLTPRLRRLAAFGVDAGGGLSECWRCQGIVLCIRFRAHQQADAGAAPEAVEGSGRCTARRNAYGLLPLAGGMDPAGRVSWGPYWGPVLDVNP